MWSQSRRWSGGALVVPASTHENRASGLMMEHLTRLGVTGRLELVLVGCGVTAGAARTLGRKHEVERRVRRAVAAAVQDADETAALSDPPQEGYVEQVFAPPEACLEPFVVVGGSVPSSSNRPPAW